MPGRVYSRNQEGMAGTFTTLGSGEIGGKASGLVRVQEILSSLFPDNRFGSYIVDIPEMVVVRTGLFRDFIEKNRLADVVTAGVSDGGIASAFLQGEFSPMFSGDLLSLVTRTATPLAVRSSSLLEDALAEPFAGIYITKMIPNNQLSPAERFRKLMEAIKLVYASVYFEEARAYTAAAGKGEQNEEMAVILQEVVGSRRGSRFYPAVSGVARSWNYYPTGNGEPCDGVVNCALGLGKTIVDGGKSWPFCPKFPASPPPYSGIKDLLNSTQTDFYAVNLAETYRYDPTGEAEFLTREPLSTAESDGVLETLCSTYDHVSDRLVQGIPGPGPRIVDFSSLLSGDDEFPDLIRTLLEGAQAHTGGPVEMEFAADFSAGAAEKRFRILQLRPLAVHEKNVDLSFVKEDPARILIEAERCSGNGVVDSISDIVYLVPERFKPGATVGIGPEIGEIDRRIRSENRKYLLIGFGRWGSSDPWLGIPVRWAEIAGAGAITESVFPNMYPDFSQGSHFFHNISNLGIPYLSVGSMERINWKWLSAQPAASESGHVRHVRTEKPITVWVDGKNGTGGVVI